jgi:phospholipase C
MVGDRALTASCAPASTRGPTLTGVVCGDYAVNTIQPMSWPYQLAKPDTFQSKNYDKLRLPSLTTSTIGDRLTAVGIDWAWYSGGWANAEGDPSQPGYTNGGGPVCSDPNALAESAWPKCPDKLFQFHHQPFNYFANFSSGTEARKNHLRDEIEFIRLAKASSHSTCNLKAVSFVKPLGAENEHPGYASEHQGNDHLVDLVLTLVSGACAKDTMIIVTYDEFGGQADHVVPPGPGNSKGPHDQWGPGSRIPALIIAPNLRNDLAVDHTVYDTTSILATIEHRFGISPLGSRDAAVNDLSAAFHADNIAPNLNKR